MSNLLVSIQDWPVIIQGALGSALFALILFASQKLYAVINHYISSLSKQSRISELNTEKLKLGMTVLKGADKAAFAAPILYRMFRPFLKAIVWLVLGLIFGEIIGFLSIVGYLGSIYYLINALNIISPYDFEGNPQERLKEINEEIERLEKQT